MKASAWWERLAGEVLQKWPVEYCAFAVVAVEASCARIKDVPK